MKIKENANREVDPQKSQQEGWDSAKAEEALGNDERSIDIGESGQLAPGGCYNHRGVNEPPRRNIDDDIVPPARGSRIDRDLDRQL